MADSPETSETANGRYDLLEPAAHVVVPQYDTEEQRTGDFGFIHSFESAGTLDGPGIRFIIFTTGCPLRCLYCHNPDTWRINNGLKMSVEEVLVEVDKYADFLIRWKSGVTVSGGEPLVQSAFLARLLRHCKERGLHTAIDTSGFLGDRMTKEMLHDTDLLLLDLKAFDDDKHRQITGVSSAVPRRFAQQLSELGKPMWIRFVLVPGLTDDFEDIEKLAEFVRQLETVERVEVLPFHKMGEAKWQAMGLDYRLTQTPPPSSELLQRVVELFRARGLETY